jgi:hypothetical protein
MLSTPDAPLLPSNVSNTKALGPNRAADIANVRWNV